MKNTTREELSRELFLKKQALEEQEGELFRKRDKGIKQLEEQAERSQYHLGDYLDGDLLITELRRLEQYKDELKEAVKFDYKQLERQKEDLETEYNQKLRKLPENNNSNNGGDH